MFIIVTDNKAEMTINEQLHFSVSDDLIPVGLVLPNNEWLPKHQKKDAS